MQPHTERYTEKADLVTDIVIGMSDGLIIPFAITTGLYNAGLDSHIIIYSGLVSAFAGAVAMAFARYFAAREDAAHSHEMEDPHHDEEILTHIGISEKTRDLIADEVAKEKEEWQNMMEANALNPEAFNPSISRTSGLFIGLSYAIAGVMPVLPFLLITDRKEGWYASVVLTVLLLLMFGFFKGKVTGVSGWTCALRVALTGVVTAMAAFYLGGLFS